MRRPNIATDPNYSPQAYLEAGALMAYLRKAAGLTQIELARRLDTLQMLVSGAETGRQKPSVQYLRDFCALFQIAPEDLGLQIVETSCRNVFDIRTGETVPRSIYRVRVLADEA